jgi:hypothetical protein
MALANDFRAQPHGFVKHDPDQHHDRAVDLARVAADLAAAA